MDDATLDAHPLSLRVLTRDLPRLGRWGVALVLAGGLFDLACHLADAMGARGLAAAEYGGHVVVLIGMVVAMAGVWSIPWQRRKIRRRKETTCC